MSNFTKRTITGIIIVVVITSAIIFSQYSFIFLLLLINIFGLHEFFNLLDSQQITPRKDQGILLSGSVFVSGILLITKICSWEILLVIIPFAFLLFLTELFSRSQNPFLNLAVTFFGITYVTIPCLFVLGIAFIPFGVKIYHSTIVFAYFSVVWASDTGAYLIGKQFGKHLFFKRISPNKTLEGSIGGVLSAFVTAYIASIFITDLSFPDFMILALIVAVAGTFGDLFKSLLKRSVDVKDSGTSLPGHGGILDRFDSLLGSAPFVFSYLLLQA